MDASTKQKELSDYAMTAIHCKARQLIGKAGLTRSAVDDIEQELALDLLQRLPAFDPKKATHNTFVTRLIERRISNLLRYRLQEKRDHRRESCSLDDLVLDSEGETVPRAWTIDQDEADIRIGRRSRTRAEETDLRLDVASVIARLPRDLRQVAELLMTESLSQAARSLGVPRKDIRRAQRRLRLVFEKSGLAGYL